MNWMVDEDRYAESDRDLAVALENAPMDKIEVIGGTLVWPTGSGGSHMTARWSKSDVANVQLRNRMRISVDYRDDCVIAYRRGVAATARYTEHADDAQATRTAVVLCALKVLAKP